MNSRKQSILVVGIAVVVAAAIAYVLYPRGPRDAALAARQRTMEVLGATIAKLQPACKVLLLSNPFTQNAGYMNEKAQYERVAIHGLRKGLGRHSPVEVAFPAIRQDYYSNPQSIVIAPDSRTPLSFLMEPASIDSLAERHAECRVIVSLVGLPLEVERLKLWSDKDPRKFALLLPDLHLLGTPIEVIQAFKRGKILVAVVEDMKSGEPLIVTQENIDDILKHQPKALGF